MGRGAVAGAAALALCILSASCAPPAPGELGASEEAITGGMRETGYPSVVLLYNGAGGLCTASIISPRVVLTARHCVTAGEGGPVTTPGNIRLYVGSSVSALTAEYTVTRIEVIPGSSATIADGLAQDLALVVLSAPAAETPMEISRTSPRSLVSTTITAIGYGQTPTSDAGTKYRTTATAQQYTYGLVFVTPSVCPGDSGGPLLGADGLIYGVASFITSPDGRTQPTCGTAPGAYNEIYSHLDWIDGVLASVGDACIPSAEVCDGMDNDCNGMVDEGCLALGTPCTDSSTCVGQLCDATIAGQVCTRECDPSRPALGCPPGFYCGATGCAGRCVPGSAGGAPIGASCTANTDCASLFCLDPGDGMQRCLEPCRVDAGLCLAGEVCFASADACGGCIAADIVRGLGHGLGEPCGRDADCRSGMVCHDTNGVRECASACAADMTCPAGFRCTEDALCVRDHSQGIGGVCEDNGDCGMGVCAALAGRSWCTATCTGDGSCPSGFSCASAGAVMVCAPDGALVGESCMGNEDCVSGLCVDDGTHSVCTQFCDAESPCASGFECRRTADGSSAVCVRPERASSGGGCAVEHGGARGAGGVASLLVIAAVWLVRRRARRRTAR